MTGDTAPLCLLALPARGELVIVHHDGSVYTVGGWRWPGLPWPLNRAGLGSGWVRWHHVHLARLCLLPLTWRQRRDARISAAFSDATWDSLTFAGPPTSMLTFGPDGPRRPAGWLGSARRRR